MKSQKMEELKDRKIEWSMNSRIEKINRNVIKGSMEGLKDFMNNKDKRQKPQ